MDGAPSQKRSATAPGRETFACLRASLKELERLDLEGCFKVTNAGLSELSNLKHLRHLDVTECNNLTAKGIRNLKVTLPDCEIVGPRDKE